MKNIYYHVHNLEYNIALWEIDEFDAHPVNNVKHFNADTFEEFTDAIYTLLPEVDVTHLIRCEIWVEVGRDLVLLESFNIDEHNKWSES